MFTQEQRDFYMKLYDADHIGMEPSSAPTPASDHTLKTEKDTHSAAGAIPINYFKCNQTESSDPNFELVKLNKARRVTTKYELKDGNS